MAMMMAMMMAMVAMMAMMVVEVVVTLVKIVLLKQVYSYVSRGVCFALDILVKLFRLQKEPAITIREAYNKPRLQLLFN